MCAVTHRAKPYQLTLLINKSLGDVIGIQQSACEATSIKIFKVKLPVLKYSFLLYLCFVCRKFY